MIPTLTINPTDCRGTSKPLTLGEIGLRLRRISRQRIQNSPYAEVRRIQCEVRGEIIVLQGTVTCYYYKQMAQEAVRSIEGSGGIANEVEVWDPPSLNRLPETEHHARRQPD